MARRLLRQMVTVATSFVLTAAAFFGVAAWRRSEDANWCRNATTAGRLQEGNQPVSPDLLERERSACAIQRQRQRAMFGSVWRTGGQEMAACGFAWARYQLHSYEDPDSAAAILERYGIDDADLASSSEDQNRFIQACLSNGPPEVG